MIPLFCVPVTFENRLMILVACVKFNIQSIIFRNISIYDIPTLNRKIAQF